MGFEIKNVLKNFHLIGVSYSHTPVSIRELFSMGDAAQKALLEDAKSLGIEGIIVLSTCNRTEVYTQTENMDLIKRLIIKHSRGSFPLLEEYGYQLKGEEAVHHLYKVGTGLDSQILGDFQVIGQLKSAYRNAEKLGTVDTLLNRMFSHVFKASKKIKNQTSLSNGAASVSYAAVQYIRENVTDLERSNLLLYGTGEIGKITCHNLIRHMNNRSLTLINRSEDRAASLAEKYNVAYKPQKKLAKELSKADIIIVATGASEPTVTKEHLQDCKKQRILLDLSIPRNIAPEVIDLPNIQLIGIDELSQLSDEALKLRQKCVPVAEEIIRENYEELCEWIEMQHLSPIFEGVKRGLNMMKDQELTYHRSKLTDEEYEKVDFIASNLMNRIAKMSILHIKDVFKSESSSKEVLARMFGQYAKQAMQHPSGRTTARHPHGQSIEQDKNKKHGH